MKRKRLIDKKYVHKKNNENILIHEVRTILPRIIEKDIFEQDVLKNVSMEDGNYLLEHYFPTPPSCHAQSYVLRTSTIEVYNHIEKFIENGQSDREGARFLRGISNLSTFTDADSTGCFLSEECSEVTETKILRILGLRHLHISDVHRMRIFKILREIKSIKFNNDVLYSLMHVNIKHPFFFEHPNEHVPGMMLIEAVRQFGVACSHLFLDVPLKGIHHILSGIKINFNGYLELNFPVKFEGRVNSAKFNKTGILAFSEFTTNVFQKNEQLASAVIVGKNLPSELFNILRRNSYDYQQSPRFIPINGEQSIKIIFKNNDETFTNSDIVNISAGGFCVITLDRILNDNVIDFELISFSENPISITGSCKAVWNRNLDSGLIIGFKIVRLDDSDYEKLNQILKLFCFVDEDREIN